MRVGVVDRKPGQQATPVHLICNHIEPIIVEVRLAQKKYKKVSKSAKARLLRCIEKGWSIINVSKKFGINYSTAKSIVQSFKKKMEKGELVPSSTDSNESIEFQIKER